ncbi:MAG: hypothetical protein R3F59_04095 [Myxococcota bacterium]
MAVQRAPPLRRRRRRPARALPHRRLARARRHFALDCYLPDRAHDRDPDERFEPRTFRHPVTGERIDSWEQGWWDEPGRIHHVLYVYRWPDGTERRSHLTLRMFELDELRQLFAAAGWRIVREAEDFVGTPLSGRPLKWVGARA